MRFHDELNPKLWNGLELKTDVKEKLNEITEAFKEYLDIPEDAILDERITGSSASYNYTEYSDLDLHLIIDYERVHEDCPLVEGYLWSYKSQFNANHDISIYGVPVELYAEDSKQEAISNGVYSLMEDKWLKEPKKIPPTDNDEDVQAKYQELKDAIDKCDDSEVANELLDKIYTMRKSGLAEVGEFSTENMAFKLLRNDGAIDKLKQLKKEKVDKQLSLESFGMEDMNKTLKSLKEYFAIVDVESGDIVDDGDDAIFDTEEEAKQAMYDRIQFGVPAEWMEVKEFEVDENLLESIKHNIMEAEGEETPFNVGDTVELKGTNVNKRKGKVLSINGDTAEVEFPETETLPTRKDTYYTNELQKTNESLLEEHKPDLNQFKFTDYPNEDGQSYKGRETYRKALQSVLDEIERKLNKCKYDYSGNTNPAKQAQIISNDVWRNSSVRDSLNLNSSTVKRQPGLYNAIKAVKDYEKQLIKGLKPLTVWNGKEWVEENKSKNESEEETMFGVEMFLDTVEGDPEPGLVEFTKEGLIEFLNDYGYDLPMDAANDEIQECAEDFGMTVKYIK